MKVLITSTGGDLNSTVDMRFARAPYLIITDTENIDNAEIIPNPFVNTPSGAGIVAAQFVIEKGIQTVISGAYGPNSSMILSSAGINMITETGGIKVKDAVEKLKNNEYKTGAPQQSIPYNYPQAGYTGFGGFGWGGGFGFGKGFGRGWGWNNPFYNWNYPQYPNQVGFYNEKEILKSAITELENQLDYYKKRLNDLENKKEEK